ncbi:MAG: hypothetical protein NW224_17880 [Leptolyngbyaceae cyanobacterium bins.302]|nr:hypothetical protein [Leptolyngbyaceae cyanobacterium bins.302]
MSNLDPKMDEASMAIDDDDEDLPQAMQARQMLPTWFVERMMTDTWWFGLMMSNGTVIGIHRILSVDQAADGTIWLTVELLSDTPEDDRIFIAPTSRLTASINASHVVAAYELLDT